MKILLEKQTCSGVIKTNVKRHDVVWQTIKKDGVLFIMMLSINGRAVFPMTLVKQYNLFIKCIIDEHYKKEQPIIVTGMDNGKYNREFYFEKRVNEILLQAHLRKANKPANELLI